MTAPRGDQAKVSVSVRVPCDEAFRVFTEEIDQWWQRGLRYRVSGKGRGVLHLEPRVGGRLFESIESRGGVKVVETGTVLAWEPPARLLLEWRNVNFAAGERTEVEVTFVDHGESTMVTVVHRGWTAIRGDHPARHGLEVPAFIRMMGMWWGDLMTSMREHVAARAEEQR